MAEYVLMTAKGRENVQSIVTALERVGTAIGSWTGQVNAREQGATYSAKFERKCGVETSIEWASQIEQAPAMLADACRKLLAADEALEAALAWREKRAEEISLDLAHLVKVRDVADELVEAVNGHKRYWPRVDWGSEQCERRILAALDRFAALSDPTANRGKEASSERPIGPE